MNARITKSLGCESPYGKPFAHKFNISSLRGCHAPFFLGCLIYQIISELSFAIGVNCEEGADVQAVQFEVEGEDPFSVSQHVLLRSTGWL